MKIAIIMFLIAFSSVAFSQTEYLEVKQEFLSNRADLGTFEISTQQATLDRSLSESLKSKVLQSSGPYSILNINEIQTLVAAEKSKLYPELKLSLSTFVESDTINMLINRINTRNGRDILRGEVEGYTGSEVKLVIYNGQLTGRIILSREPKVMLIRSINGGITANYEIDTSDIRYD